MLHCTLPAHAILGCVHHAGRGAVHAENRSVFARLSRDGGNGGAGATAKRKNVLDRIEKPKPVFSSGKSVRGRGNSLAEQ